MAAEPKKKPEKRKTGTVQPRHTLRDDAEKQLAHAKKGAPDLNVQTAEALIHELQVHQIELEMQAEELRRAQLALEESRDQYLDLYDFAPLGYLTLTDNALISQANLSAATLLGIDRNRLIHARFRTWIVFEDLDIWDRYFMNLLKSEKKFSATLMLKRGEKTTFPARLESIRTKDSNGRVSIRVAVSDIMDIRHAERARRESEHLLKMVIELLPVGVMILNSKGEVIVINPEAERIWGRIRAVGTGHFSGFRCWRLEDGVRIESPDLAGARAIKNGETTLEEQIEIESTSGIHKIVLNSALPIKRSDQSISGAVVVTQDITEGKAAEEQIRWLASFPELNPDPVIELDREGTIMFANPATRTILKTLDLPDDPALFIPEDKEEILRLLEAGSAHQIYREIILGSEIFAESIALDAVLQVVRIYARNITEHKEAELELKESEEFNRSLVENLPDFVVVCGPDLKVLYVNPAAGRRLGLDARKLAGTPVLAYIPEEYHEKVTKKIAVIFNGGIFSPHEIAILTGDGSRISVIVRGTPIQYYGTPAILLLLTDITDRKLLEDTLKKESAKLSLLSHALQAANKKHNLLSSITRHDIKNHLTVVLGYLAMLSEDEPEEASREVIQKVTQASRNISDMIQFTKIYREIGINDPLFLDVRTLVETAMQGIPGSVRFNNELPEGMTVLADPLIAGVFSTLADNAIRHGKTTTTLRFSGLEQDENYVITCQDDGIGIPADHKEKIFESGYGQNTSLGLFLAREILAVTGIQIRETGEPGNGARFEITVPKGMWQI
ncbi:MAG: PAS domain-containing sensor histidine kinase [Methanoregula sp.]|nr:PAS domain-containing sensor histidine kinase [Methanoregula sp.]